MWLTLTLKCRIAECLQFMMTIPSPIDSTTVLPHAFMLAVSPLVRQSCMGACLFLSFSKFVIKILQLCAFLSFAGDCSTLITFGYLNWKFWVLNVSAMNCLPRMHLFSSVYHAKNKYFSIKTYIPLWMSTPTSLSQQPLGASFCSVWINTLPSM